MCSEVKRDREKFSTLFVCLVLFLGRDMREADESQEIDRGMFDSLEHVMTINVMSVSQASLDKHTFL